MTRSERFLFSRMIKTDPNGIQNLVRRDRGVTAATCICVNRNRGVAAILIWDRAKCFWQPAAPHSPNSMPRAETPMEKIDNADGL